MAEASDTFFANEKNKIFEIAANANSDFDEEIIPDAIGENEYNISFGSDNSLSDFEGFEVEFEARNDQNASQADSESGPTNLPRARSTDKSVPEGFKMGHTLVYISH